MPGPLENIRVVELAHDLAGAFGGQILADEGAEVIKVEPPTGDPLRHRDPYADGESRLFQSLNRGKRSVVLDLAEAEPRAVLVRLVTGADVLLTTFAAADLDRLGLAEAALSDAAPRLVQVRVSPLGERGPWADAPMGSLCLQAFSGLMAAEGKQLQEEANATAPAGAPAAITATDMVERATGLYAALGASAGLFERLRSSRGATVAFSKLAVSAFLQGPRTGDVPAAGARTGGSQARDRLLALRAEGAPFADLAAARASPAAGVGQPYYRAYNTRDGAVFIGALSAPLRARARRAMETDFLHRDDPAWNPADPEFLALCAQKQVEIEAHMRSRTTEEWIARCEAENVPAGEVVFPEDLADNAQALANHLMVRIDHVTAGAQIQAAPFIRFHRHPRPELAGAPALEPLRRPIL